MRNLFIRFVINAAGLYVAAQVVPDHGIKLTGGWENLLLVAIVFGVVNALVRPVLAALTCLINVLTLGLFTFVLNAFMLLITSWIGTNLRIGFEVKDFGSALLGAVVISLVSFVLSFVVHEDRGR
ncbi:MAG: phage holin family protein [Chloroflexi bacterium]|nr:phage holin family protein [Chloroflexota bacterium]MBI3734213.1 phage holin family protein [Chloroflexota bacterium]